MKNYKSIFRFGLMAALILMINPAFMKPDDKPYEELWKEVDALMEKGLPRSALEVIDVVQQKALTENQGQQLLKAAIYRFAANQLFEEDHLPKAIGFAQTQLPYLKTPEKQILQSILAELYVFYYQQNRFGLLDRTAIAGERPENMMEWDLTTLREVIRETYLSSLQKAEELATFQLADYETLLILPDKESTDLQPTVYDFLVHRALNFLLSGDAGIKPEASPSLNHKGLFSPVADFIKLDFSKNDSDIELSINLIQQLLKLHHASGDVTALVYNDIKRIELAHAHYRGSEDKDQLFEQALTGLLQRHRKHPASADISYALANFLVQSDLAIPEEMEIDKRFKLKEALSLCEQALEEHPKSRGAANCKVLQAQILNKELAITVQRVSSPDEAIPALLDYRNITTPAFRLISIETEELENIMGIVNSEQQREAMLALQPMKSWELSLPFEEDYRSHNMVINLPPLSKGLYLLLASSDEDFAKGEIIEYASFQVSGLSFISSKREGTNHFYLLERESGKPVRNATIHIMSRAYDYSNRKYTIEKKLELKTARDGSFSFGADDNLPGNRAFYVEAITKDDRLYSDNYFDVYKARENKRVQIRTWFFTDRAIYRPGQAIHFKGIVLEKQGDDYDIVKNQERTIRFFDANGQEVSSLKLRTNDYGSFEGSFVAPLGALTGQMRITDNSGSTYVSVEEYKRPTFEVKLKMPEGQYRLNDTISLTGEAMAYAGYPIDTVPFSYKVYREPFFPWRPVWFGMPPFGGERHLIASGESFTNKDGSFNLSFKAVPDYGMNRRFDAAYAYTVEVDVTDRNGETRSGSQNIRAGEKALILKTDLKETLEQQELSGIKLHATNLQGEAVKAVVSISVHKLARANRLVRPALWPMPDRQLLDKEEFEQLFPMDAWDDSQDLLKRERILVHTFTVNLDGTAPLLPEAFDMQPDNSYLIVAESTDDFGQKVELMQTFQLFKKDGKDLPDNVFSWFNISHQEAQPGETVYLTVGTATRNTRFLLEIFAGDKLIQSEWVSLSNEKQSLPLLIDESHRGMLRFQGTAVRHNRILSQSYLVKVPHSDKMLNIELLTKREKLNPGASETWELKITGNNKEGIAAELLASMYDASLDQFKPNNWYFDLLSYPAPPRQWQSDNGFLTYRSSSLMRQRIPDRSLLFVRPPQLNWFGFSGGYGGYYSRTAAMPLMGKQMEVHETADDMSFAAVIQDQDVPPATNQDATGQEAQQAAQTDSQTPVVRTNFNETAFFYPRLLAAEDGSVRISFTLPDALTRWKLMLLAHTKDLKTGMQEYNFTASKKMMIVPNTSRFYREGDTAWMAAKVVNTGEKMLTGIARLELFDAFTEKEIPYIANNQFQKPFVNLMPGRSQEVSWKLHIGDEVNLLGLRFSASAEGFTDSEEQFIPILPRKVLVTETMPLYVMGGQTKDYVFESLRDNPTRKNHMMRIDFSSNPVWYAIQALPYLQDEKENIHGIFNRFYANSLASHIANSIPGVMRAIESWKAHSPDAFLSELEKNQELKSVLLNETPWVMQARSESEQKRNIVLLFDLNRMRYEQQQSLSLLAAQQLPNGAWPWFNGMRENRFITQTLVNGLGRLQQLGVQIEQDNRITFMLNQAVGYLDMVNHEDYQRIRKEETPKEYTISPIHLNYLYGRSFFMDITVKEEHQPAIDFYLDHAGSGWLKLDAGMQALAAIVLKRFGREAAATDILASLRERALHSDELGTYWHQAAGYMWHQTPIENHVWLIEAFTAMQAETSEIDGMRTWLLSQKRTTHWPTGRATADAIYALLMQGTDWTQTKNATIVVGAEKLETDEAHAGTGFVSKQWFGKEVSAEMANITITNPNKGMAWGGVYLQYFEDIDKVKGQVTPLQLQKEIFVKKVTPKGEQLLPLSNRKLQIGDEVVIRLLLQVDRHMEFVHLKDERAAAFEPLDVLSGYNWRDNLGFYQSTKDASTEFFFAHLPKGNYVFEYSLRASHTGDFAAGLAKIQCLYAPEFAAHSKGVRVLVE